MYLFGGLGLCLLHSAKSIADVEDGVFYFAAMQYVHDVKHQEKDSEEYRRQNNPHKKPSEKIIDG